jgi:hypothetical protein
MGASRIGMGCTAKSAAIPEGIASIFNAAARLNRVCSVRRKLDLAFEATIQMPVYDRLTLALMQRLLHQAKPSGIASSRYGQHLYLLRKHHLVSPCRATTAQHADGHGHCGGA